MQALRILQGLLLLKALGLVWGSDLNVSFVNLCTCVMQHRVPFGTLAQSAFWTCSTAKHSTGSPVGVPDCTRRVLQEACSGHGERSDLIHDLGCQSSKIVLHPSFQNASLRLLHRRAFCRRG